MTTELTPMTEDMRINAQREKYLVWMVLLVTAVTYLGTIRFGFVYDDSPVIVNNPLLKAWRYVPQYFVSSLWKQMDPSVPANYYRPIYLLVMRIGYALFATRPLGWHLLAIVMHLLVTWLTYILVRKMGGQFITAWLTAVIFGVHPIHHEVVAWAASVSESLFATLFLLTFMAYLRSLQGPKAFWMTLSCALYGLALLTKETAALLPVLVFSYAWIGYSPAENESRAGYADRFRKAFTPTVFFFPIALLYLFVRNKALSGLGHAVAPVSPVTWFLTLPSILLFYVKHWVFPIGLSEFYDLFYQPRLNTAHVLLPAMILIALGAAVWVLRNRLGGKAVGFAAAWILIPLVPALATFVFTPDSLVHDRYFYVPSIGAAFLTALLIESVSKSHRSVFGQPMHVVLTGMALSFLLGSLTGYAVSFWRSDYALFTRAHQIAPLNTVAINDLAIEMFNIHAMEGAQKLLETGYRNNPTDIHFPLNLGRLYYSKGDYQKAETYMLQAKNLAPELADPYVFLGQIQLRQHRVKEAQESLRLAVNLNPYSAQNHTIYGIVLASNGDCADADQQFEASLALEPGDALTQVQMSRCRAALSPSTLPATKPGQL